MGKHVDALNWSKFPNEPAADGAKWVKLEDVQRAVTLDEAHLEERVEDRCRSRWKESR